MAFGAVTNPDRLLYRFLDTEGDGTGDFDMTGNYLGSPTTFKVMADREGPLWMAQLILTIGALKWSDCGPEKYGELSPLPVPTNFYFLDPDGNPVGESVRGGAGITTVKDLMEVGWVARPFWTKQNDSALLQFIWNFESAGSFLHIPFGFGVGFIVASDFSALPSHRVIAHGFVGAKTGISKFMI